jgi:hypothetical protein
MRSNALIRVIRDAALTITALCMFPFALQAQTPEPTRRLRPCKADEPTFPEVVAIADSIVLGLKPLHGMSPADTLALYIALDSTHAVLGVRHKKWAIGPLSPQLREVFPDLELRGMPSAGVLMMHAGVPVFGPHRVMLSYGYYCGRYRGP